MVSVDGLAVLYGVSKMVFYAWSDKERCKGPLRRQPFTPPKASAPLSPNSQVSLSLHSLTSHTMYVSPSAPLPLAHLSSSFRSVSPHSHSYKPPSLHITSYTCRPRTWVVSLIRLVSLLAQLRTRTVIKCVCICEYSLMWELTWMLRRVTYSRAWMVCFPLAASKVIVTSLLLSRWETYPNDEVVFGPCTVSTQVPPSHLSQILLKRRLAHWQPRRLVSKSNN